MKRLRVLFAVLLSVMFIFLQGCNGSSIISERLELLEFQTMNESKENLQMSKDVLNCFNDDNAKGLKSLLCLKTQELVDIDEQILAGFDFIKGKVISFDEENVTGYESKSIELGETTELERAWYISDIKSDTDETYEIYISVYYIYKNDKTREGISQMIITRITGEELIIGYTWPIYEGEARNISSNIVDKFDTKDKNGLKEMLCATTLEIDDIDKQIKAAFDFYDGNSIDGYLGKDQEGHDLYDGSRDWYITVSDNQKITNGAPLITSIDVEIFNIQTDKGKKYKIYFSSKILDHEDESSVGISGITIENEDGEKQSIGERLD